MGPSAGADFLQIDSCFIQSTQSGIRSRSVPGPSPPDGGSASCRAGPDSPLHPDAPIEQLTDQGALAAAGFHHDIEVVAGMAHADTEMCRVDGTHLADALGQIAEFGGGGEGERVGIAAANPAVRRDVAKSASFLVVLWRIAQLF